MRVLFYQAGDEGKEIVASGELISGLQSDDRQRDYVVVGDVKPFVRPIPMRKIVSDLSFVKDAKHWGIHFKGGVRKIPERDYKMILRRTKRESLIVSSQS